MMQRTKVIYDSYIDQIEEKKIGLAGKDLEGYIIIDEKGHYKMTPAAQKEMKDFIKEKRIEDVNIEPYYSIQEMDIDIMTREILTPFVFEEIKENELLYLNREE